MPVFRQMLFTYLNFCQLFIATQYHFLVHRSKVLYPPKGYNGNNYVPIYVHIVEISEINIQH